MTTELLRRARAALATAALAAAGLAVPAAAQVIDLSGRTVTLIHNAAPGGSTALGAQIAADAWMKTMAGNPTIVVQSVEGGALARGINQVLNSRPDGLTLGWLAWSGSTRILDAPELQIPFERFGMIGAVGGANFFVHVSTSVGGGLTNRDEFPQKVERLTFGGFNPRSASAMRMAGALDMLGVDWRFVSGMSGDAPLQAALERGEIEGYPATTIFLQRQLRDNQIAQGQSMGLFYFSPVNAEGTALITDPLAPDLEPFDVYYRRVMGKEPEGPIWEMIKFHGRVSDKANWIVVAPPGTPAEHLAMLRESFAQAVSSPEFLEAAERVFGQRPIISVAEEADAIVQEVQQTPEELRAIMRAYIERMEG